MKTLVCTSPGLFEYRPGEKPLLAKGNAIIKIKRVGICGTDLHAYEGTQPYFEYPRILGHELAGELVEWIMPKVLKKAKRLRLFLILTAVPVLPAATANLIAVLL